MTELTRRMPATARSTSTTSRPGPTKPTDEPMWVLNLMHYRETGRLRATGARRHQRPGGRRPVRAARAARRDRRRDRVRGDVVDQLPATTQVGPGRDRALPEPRALIEMKHAPEFKETHVHKDAGMASTIVAATFPQAGQRSTARWRQRHDAESCCCCRSSADADAPRSRSRARGAFATFDIEGVVIGDDRTWAEARWDLLPAAATAEGVRDERATDADRHVRAQASATAIVMRAVLNSETLVTTCRVLLAPRLRRS